MDSNELKKCPFCGGPADLAQEYINDSDQYLIFVECKLCGVRGKAVSSWASSKDYAWMTEPVDLAREFWNTRAS